MTDTLKFTADGMPIRMFAQEVEPPQAGGAGTIILMHGSGGHLDFWVSRMAPLLQQAGISLYAPHYFDRTGTVRADLAAITDGVHVPAWLGVLNQAVRFVVSRQGVDPRRIVLAGISLGAFLSLALAADLSASDDPADRGRIRAILEVSGGLVAPFYERATTDFPPTLILHGDEDRIVPPSQARDLDSRLTQLDVAHRTEILPGEGHWFSSAAMPRMLMAVSAFLQEHMQAHGSPSVTM